MAWENDIKYKTIWNIKVKNNMKEYVVQYISKGYTWKEKHGSNKITIIGYPGITGLCVIDFLLYDCLSSSFSNVEQVCMFVYVCCRRNGVGASHILLASCLNSWRNCSPSLCTLYGNKDPLTLLWCENEDEWTELWTSGRGRKWETKVGGWNLEAGGPGTESSSNIWLPQ